MGDKIDARFLNVLELVSIAAYQSQANKLTTLDRAIMAIDILKFLLRVSWELNILDDKKYTTLSEGVQEVGRQTGGWKKGIQNKTPGK